jgi:hypothetical protein
VLAVALKSQPQPVAAAAEATEPTPAAKASTGGKRASKRPAKPVHAH